MLYSILDRINYTLLGIKSHCQKVPNGEPNNKLEDGRLGGGIVLNGKRLYDNESSSDGDIIITGSGPGESFQTVSQTLSDSSIYIETSPRYNDHVYWEDDQ